jgi:hypothetical protein
MAMIDVATTILQATAHQLGKQCSSTTPYAAACSTRALCWQHPLLTCCSFAMTPEQLGQQYYCKLLEAFE